MGGLPYPLRTANPPSTASACSPFFGVEVRQLPEAHTEAILEQVREHLLGVLESALRELEVAAVRDLRPVGVEVDDVRGDAVLA